MRGFSADWLALREPADRQARSKSLARRLGRWRPPGRALEIVDLGAGLGANPRILAPILGGVQRWLLADNRPSLLDRIPATMVAWAAERGAWEFQTVNVDISRDRPRPGDLVTASALMDLVSAAWFDSLAEACFAGRTALFLALTYDGAITWDPADEFDETVRALVNRHQLGDKGFGPALGPGAFDHMARTLRRLGYAAWDAASPWRLTPSQGALQQALLEGWVEAALEVEPQGSQPLDRWRTRRRHWIAEGVSRLTVGHRDLFAHL